MWIWPSNMRPMHDAEGGETHQPACCAKQMEPPQLWSLPLSWMRRSKIQVIVTYGVTY